jgi:hypothetical protein
MSLNITSYDPSVLKQSLIEFIQSKNEFSEFNYDGSAINTIIDLLVRNTHYIAYMANMASTESFLDSAVLRSNIVSHAQKLSYVPKSRTATTVKVALEVIPPALGPEFIITCEKGSSFINTIAGVSYNFTNTSNVSLTKTASGTYVANNVELKQGQLSSQRFLYQRELGKIEIQNKDIDTATLKIMVKDSQTAITSTEFLLVTDITDVSAESRVFYLSENSRGYYQVEFGKDVLGFEPLDGSVIEVEYILVEPEHANGIKELFGASPIGNYSNVVVDVETEGYGGAERASNAFIKFIAPKIYETQNRAVKAQDYASLVMRDFSFIKSAIAWGGEENEPPYYGRVFISTIPQEGFIVADSIKSIIVEKMKSYSLMTTEVVDISYLGLNLKVNILYHKNKTSDTFEQLSTKVVAVVDQYTEEIREFDRWYNNSQLISKLQQALPVVYSVEVDKTCFIDVEASVNTTIRYEETFANQILPGSFLLKDIILDVLASSQKIYDDGLGNLVKEVTIGTITSKTNIGTINYTTGQFSFTLTVLSPKVLRITAVPVNDNFYTKRNFIVNIDEVSVGLLDNRGN